ncbi:formyl transferase [Virgisporangium aliadipatigenens]|uniref:Formyl transferase n=1 Tax=Virgisporangium aliadipatigenens TaxID=741659 RepID=A0A8J3YFA1_9ACTN|nr:enoyl-CoA hydratase-related protein [Virgisporangium aliadipatigenens]GIJ43207.1 formyl transferase [Virgisporangium aliadipatigenens]
MRILLLASAFNGLTQRVWCRLRAGGHRVSVQLSTSPEAMLHGVRAFGPELVVCPFLKEKVPEEIWRHWRTVIIHPGPVGDRGPSSLDHAITDGARIWGVTALQAIEEMDAGPVWATRIFTIPEDPPRKSALYNGPVADAAVECVEEVVAKASDPSFQPIPLERAPRAVPGTGLRPLVRQSDRAFAWDDDPERIVRHIRAADGFPGVRTRIGGLEVRAFDASVGGIAGPPGEILGRRYGAVLVGTGHGSVWIGQLNRVREDGGPSLKLFATAVLRRSVPEAPAQAGGERYAPVHYHRDGPVGTLTFRAYNGAMSTRQCRMVAAGLRAALRDDTRVLVVRGTHESFSNGIHLGVIEAAPEPAAEAWANIRAINAICRRLCAATGKVLVSAYTAGAGAGGAMLGLGADVVVARAGVVLNPFYDMGLYGSELHTYALPARVGPEQATALLHNKLPVDADRARSLGLVDAVGPREPQEFDGWLGEVAAGWADPARWRSTVDARRARAAKQRWPLSYHETVELGEMARDLFDDRQRFDRARKAFIYKEPPCATPARLIAD